MDTAPPIVEHALSTRRRTVATLILGAVGVATSAAAALAVLGLFSAPVHAAALGTWVVATSTLYAVAATRVVAATRWTQPILRAHHDAVAAQEAETHIALWGEPTAEPLPVLSAIRRLCARIDGLAEDRLWLLELTRKARETAGRLRTERQAMCRVAEERLDASQLVEQLDADLDAICVRLLCIVERLVTEQASDGLDALDDGLARLDAASEVRSSTRTATVHPLRAAGS